MVNVLNMEKRALIEQLLALGWSYRRIESETGIRRETVSRYDPSHLRHRRGGTSKPAKVTTDPGDQNRPKYSPTIAPEVLQKPTRQSASAPYDAYIRERISRGLTAHRIYQDLVVEEGFSHSYESVKRYVRKLKCREPEVFARLHSEPGEEAQVDLGKGAPTLKNGRYVRPWLFKMVLSYSRHSYEEVVWRQDVESFICCHEHAFAEFGGVPGMVRLDNLKSAVLVAHLYEPALNPLYAAFAEHAGFTPLPCLPRKPEHKGKVESGIGYTKRSALKGLKFDSLDAQNAHLRHWNRKWARTRIHGTTKRQVWTVFVEEERDALRPLPEKSFTFFRIGTRRVHADGHIEVERAYYSVPHRHVGETLTVHYNARWVKAIKGAEVIAFHRRAEPGRFQTVNDHLPEKKSLTAERYKEKLLKQCTTIGPGCREWAMDAFNRRGQLALRAIQGVVVLGRKYAPSKINWACAQALKMGSLRYHTVKLLCEDEQGGDPDEGNKTNTRLLQRHEIIRGPEEYQNYLDGIAEKDHL